VTARPAPRSRIRSGWWPLEPDTARSIPGPLSLWFCVPSVAAAGSQQASSPEPPFTSEDYDPDGLDDELGGVLVRCEACPTPDKWIAGEITARRHVLVDAASEDEPH